MNGGPRHVPVLIAGGGPVGLHLSVELGARGIPCLLVNEREKTTTHPKGSTLNSRSMEIFRRLGYAEDVRHVGVPLDHPGDIAYVTRLTGYELIRHRQPTGLEKISNRGPWGPTLLTTEPIHRANQFYFEAVMKEVAERYATSELRFGWRLAEFEDAGDRVVCEIEDVRTGARESVTADYLAGCDGGRSVVRRELGFTYSGRSSSGDKFYDGRMVSAYVRSPAVYDVKSIETAWHYWTINSDGRLDIITLDGKGDFLILAEMPGDTDIEALDTAQMFRTAVGKDLAVEQLTTQEWMAGLALVTDGYQRGRVFLAGDAVHLFTPSGGFGMNTGVEDAANLGWKLAAAVKGWGGPKLLESYEIERRPVGIRNTTTSGDYANNIGVLTFPPNLEDDTPEGQAARDEFGAKLDSFKEEFASIGIQLGARYDASHLIVSDGSAPPPQSPVTYIPSACPGGRAPHYWLQDGSSLYDHFGPEFTLLRIGPTAPDGGALAAAADAAGVPLRRFDLAEDEARDLYEADLALIRPDQHVAWRGNKLPDDPAALIATVTGH